MRGRVLALQSQGQDGIDSLTRLRAKLTISQLVRMVDFAVADPKHTSGYFVAMAVPVNGPLDAESPKIFPSGCRTRIEFNPTSTENLEYIQQRSKGHIMEGYAGSKMDHVLECLVVLRFNFAVHLVHELAHALVNATIGTPPAEPYYKDNLMSEAGIALENQLFGGKVCGGDGSGLDSLQRSKSCNSPLYTEQENRKQFVCMRELPSASLWNMYKYRGGLMHARRKVPIFDTVWRIPMSSVEAYFTREFWADVACQSDPTSALQLPKVLGWVYRSSGRGNLYPITGADATLPPAAQRIFKKRNLGLLKVADLGAELARACEDAQDWPDILDGMGPDWQRVIEERSRAQRKKDNRKAAKAAGK